MKMTTSTRTANNNFDLAIVVMRLLNEYSHDNAVIELLTMSNNKFDYVMLETAKFAVYVAAAALIENRSLDELNEEHLVRDGAYDGSIYIMMERIKNNLYDY